MEYILGRWRLGIVPNIPLLAAPAMYLISLFHVRIFVLFKARIFGIPQRPLVDRVCSVCVLEVWLCLNSILFLSNNRKISDRYSICLIDCYNSLEAMQWHLCCCSEGILAWSWFSGLFIKLYNAVVSYLAGRSFEDQSIAGFLRHQRSSNVCTSNPSPISTNLIFGTFYWFCCRMI